MSSNSKDNKRRDMFRGKTVIITGAGRGIGRETALLMARLGANVVVNDLGGGPMGGGSDKSVAREVVEEIRDLGGSAIAQCSSIGEWDGCEAVVDCAIDNFGRIDYLINNAGIIIPKRIWDMDEEDVDEALDVNLKGCIGMVRHAAKHLKKRGGVIVNVSSHSGLGMYAASAYGAAKEGVVGFTRCIARDLGEFDVRCHAVRPLTIDSNMVTPEVVETVQHHQRTYNLPVLGNQLPGDGGAEGTSEHVAAALAWLCTPYAEPINGREITIHGGFISLYQEPEQVRARAHPGGWTFDALCSRKAVESLTIGQFNPYKKKTYDFYDDVSSNLDYERKATEDLTACCGSPGGNNRMRPHSTVHYETNEASPPGNRRSSSGSDRPHRRTPQRSKSGGRRTVNGSDSNRSRNKRATCQEVEGTNGSNRRSGRTTKGNTSHKKVSHEREPIKTKESHDPERQLENEEEEVVVVGEALGYLHDRAHTGDDDPPDEGQAIDYGYGPGEPDYEYGNAEPDDNAEVSGEQDEYAEFLAQQQPHTSSANM